MNSPTPPEQETPTWCRQKLKDIYWKIHATFPNIIATPHRQDRDFFIQRARTQNEKTRVPESEELRRRIVWGAEIFGPAEIESFYRQIKKLDWHEPQDHRIGKNVIETIRGWRTYGLIGNFNIGVVQPSKSSGFRHTYVGPVPKDAEYLLVNVVQFSPELTCVIVGFVLKEEVTKSYERELNKDRKFEHRAKFGRFSYSTYGPESLKREAIDNERTRCRAMVSSWFKNNFRGFFYSSSLGGRLPLVELITCKNVAVLTHPTESSENDDWARLLVPHGWGEVWNSKKYPGFRMRRSDTGDDMPFDSIVSIQTSTLPAEEFEIYGGLTSSSIAAFVHERIDDFICQNAVLHMLHEIARILKDGREKLEIGGTRYGKILKSIDEIKSLFDRSIGFPAILNEIHSKAEKDWAYRWSGNEFENTPWPAERPVEKLSETLRLYTMSLSKRLIDDDAATREHFEQLVSILSTRESVKTQRRMEYLTYLTIVLALGSLAISLSPDSWIQKVKTYAGKKFDSK